MDKLEKLKQTYLEMGKEIEKLEKEDGLPNSWEEFAEHYGLTTFDDTWNVHAPRYKALRKLELLRDCYNGDWNADCMDYEQDKFVLSFRKNKI